MILVTGSTGFVGQALCAGLIDRVCDVKGVVRSKKSVPTVSVDHLNYVEIGNIDAHTEWASDLLGVDCVIHCVARAHVMNETESDALSAYRAVNVEGTKRLAEQAASAGVKRLVYLSSIKVNGEGTTGSSPYSYADTPSPEDPYGVSKWEAEQALLEISARTGLEVVIIRPPLVYGPGVKGNLARLLGLVRRGLPLPIGAVDNRRSLIGLDNLVDLLIHCVDHPDAAGKTFLVSDGEDFSTPELLRRIASSMGRSARLFPLPLPMLLFAGRALGRLDEVDRLVGSLQVDSRYTREVLDWTPPVSVDEGIRRMVQEGEVKGGS